uniref:Uncharacterized protein n=1 Tax=Arundo donax TaxID=35708 RepID=A0A0A9HQ50_ARUDO
MIVKYGTLGSRHSDANIVVLCYGMRRD